MHSKRAELRSCDLDDTGLLTREALTSNVSLEVLDVRCNDFTHNGAQFFELLPQMKGLKAVYGLVVEMNDVLLKLLEWRSLTVSEKYQVTKDLRGR
jgi:Ran GTPase-activating protein (RanGAP) involved in mRNA processing and transport